MELITGLAELFAVLINHAISKEYFRLTSFRIRRNYKNKNLVSVQPVQLVQLN